MILVSFGVPQSGTTLAFEMARGVLELNGHPQERLPDGLVEPGHHINFVRDWTDELLARLIEASAGTRIAVKTHRAAPPTSAVLLDAMHAGHLKVHVVYRDPRDTVASMIDFGIRSKGAAESTVEFPRTVDHAIQRLAGRLPALRQWGSFASLELRYEEFAFHPTAGPAAIAADLGVSADPAKVWAIVDDAFTQLNVARPQRHATDLWPDEVARVEAAFPLFLEAVRGRPVPGWYDPDAA